MKLQFKKYIFLINDVTNMLLGKERLNLENNLKKLKQIIIILSVLLLISIMLNILLIIKSLGS